MDDGQIKEKIKPEEYCICFSIMDYDVKLQVTLSSFLKNKLLKQKPTKYDRTGQPNSTVVSVNQYF